MLKYPNEEEDFFSFLFSFDYHDDISAKTMMTKKIYYLPITKKSIFTSIGAG